MKPPSTPTTMSAAFAAAGVKPPGDRLIDIATEAWTRWSVLSGAGARTDYVRTALRGDMTWSLVEQYASERVLTDAISRLLNDAKERIASQQPKKRDAASAAGGGHDRSETPGRSATTEPSSQSGQNSSETQKAPAAPAGRKAGQPPSEAQTVTASLASLSEKHAAAATARLHVELRLADKILINGKPLRQCTVFDVRRWADERQRDARNGWRDYLFAQNLIANLPGHSVIGTRWRDEEIERMYERAGESYDIAAQ